MANRENNKGGNSQLKGKTWNCPNNILNELQRVVRNYESSNKDKKTQGYTRAKNIIDKDGVITYENLKRIKNFFDHNDEESEEFKLNGGKRMKKWVDETLYKATKGIENIKDAKQYAGEENSHIKSHEKNTKVKTTFSHDEIPKLHKGSTFKNIMRGKPIYEEIERIKELITYKSKI